MDFKEKKELKKKVDFIASVFLQNERISNFIRDMDHYKYKDLKKLQRLIRDLEGDLKFHSKKKVKDTKRIDEINKELNEIDIYSEQDKFVELLLDKKEQLILIAGQSGLIPDYVSGMERHQR